MVGERKMFSQNGGTICYPPLAHTSGVLTLVLFFVTVVIYALHFNTTILMCSTMRCMFQSI
jgi:hypothetical protein